MTTRLTTIALVALLASALPAQADQAGCTTEAKNMQCTEFGTIMMDAQRDIRGEPIDLRADIFLNTDYEESGARWVLFSVRNVESDGSEPISLKLVRFGTDQGDIVTTRVEHDKASEINLWVDTLDLPTNTPIAIDLQVGASDRGAFKVETLVLAFDRGYAPIMTASGAEASLFSFTLLGVNEETEEVDGTGDRGVAKGKKLPGFGPVAALLALAFAGTAFAARRKQA